MKMPTGRPRGRPKKSQAAISAPMPAEPTTVLAPVPSAKKGSSEEIVERRQKVLRMRLRGMGYRDIAKALGISPMTIKHDLELIREETGTRMSKLQRDIVLAQSLSVYEEIETQAWDQFSKATDGSQSKAHFLNVVRSARNDQTKLLMDIGLIQKTPQEVKHMVTSKVIDGWTPAAQDLVALAIIKASLSPSIAPVSDDHQLSANSTLPVIEAESKEVETAK